MTNQGVRFFDPQSLDLKWVVGILSLHTRINRGWRRCSMSFTGLKSAYTVVARANLKTRATLKEVWTATNPLVGLLVSQVPRTNHYGWTSTRQTRVADRESFEFGNPECEALCIECVETSVQQFLRSVGFAARHRTVLHEHPLLFILYQGSRPHQALFVGPISVFAGPPHLNEIIFVMTLE